jgi:hypothetical protein
LVKRAVGHVAPSIPRLLGSGGNLETVGLGRLLAAQVEAHALYVVAQLAGYRVVPLRLVRVDEYASSVLLVIPAAGKLLTAHHVEGGAREGGKSLKRTLDGDL